MILTPLNTNTPRFLRREYSNISTIKIEITRSKTASVYSDWLEKTPPKPKITSTSGSGLKRTVSFTGNLNLIPELSI